MFTVATCKCVGQKKAENYVRFFNSNYKTKIKFIAL